MKKLKGEIYITGVIHLTQRWTLQYHILIVQYKESIVRDRCKYEIREIQPGPTYSWAVCWLMHTNSIPANLFRSSNHKKW